MRLFQKSVSKILKKLEVLIDAHLYDLKTIVNSQANRLHLVFDGKDREIEVQTQQDVQLVRVIRTALARITSGFDPIALPRLDLLPDRVNSTVDAVDVGIAGGIIPTYEAMCDYYAVPVSKLFIAFVNDAVNAGLLSLDLSECPGIEANDGGTSAALVPILASFGHNTYFKGISLRNVPRSDMWKAATLLIRCANHTLTKLVLRDTNGDARDAKAFFDAWIAAVNGLQIAVLDVGGNKMSADACQSLGDALEQSLTALSVLSLADCSLPAAGVSELCVALARSLKTSLLLTTLYLDGAKFDQDANDNFGYWLSLIGKHGNLQQVSLSNCSGLELSAAFRPLIAGSTHCLTHLDLSQNKLDVGFLSSQILANSKTLNSLKVADCGITSELFVQIVNAISGNSSLINFELVASQNPIGSNASIVVQSLQKCQNLVRLDLRSCGFTFHGAQLVLDAINTLLGNLRSVFVGGIGLGSLRKTTPDLINQMMGFAYALSKTLSTHISLTEVGIDATSMTYAGWQSAFSTLPASKLNRLVLTGALLGDVGMQAFCEGLRGNTSISELELDNNRITLNGLLDLRSALRQCRTVLFMPLPSADIQAVLQSCGKPLSSKWSDVQDLLTEISALIASVGGVRVSQYPISSTNSNRSVWALEAPERALPQLTDVPADIVPVHELPPKYRDRKAWQEWRLQKLEGKLGELTRAALAGGYVAGAGSSGGASMDASYGNNNNNDVTPAAAAAPPVHFGSNTLNLLADLDDDNNAAPPPPPQDADDDWNDQTIDAKRAPPPPPY